MGILGKLFGTDEAISKTIDTVANGLDKLHYSAEEKAEDAAKARTEARNMFIAWIDKTQGQNLARRILALAICGVWLGQYACFVLCGVLSIFFDGKTLTTTTMINGAAQTTQISAVERAGDVFLSGANDMNAAAMLILTFYFAAPHMGSVIEVILGKMSKGFKK